MRFQRSSLYHGLASTCSKKVRFCLYEKNVPFKSHLLDLQKFEQHRPQYLELNPNGVVPTLVHDGHPIIEFQHHQRVYRRGISRASLETARPCRPRTDEGLDKILRRRGVQSGLRADMARLACASGQGIFRGVTREDLGPNPLTRAKAALGTDVERRLLGERAGGGLRQNAVMPRRGGERLEPTAVARGQPDFPGRHGNGAVRRSYPQLASGFHGCRRVSQPEAWCDRLRERPAFRQAFDFTDDPRAKELPNL